MNIFVVQSYPQGECSIQDGANCHFENEACYEIISILSTFKCDTSGLVKFGQRIHLWVHLIHMTKDIYILSKMAAIFLKIAIDIVI